MRKSIPTQRIEAVSALVALESCARDLARANAAGGPAVPGYAGIVAAYHAADDAASEANRHRAGMSPSDDCLVHVGSEPREFETLMVSHE